MGKVTAGQAEELVDWRHRAACRDEDPDLFFPVATTGPVFERQVAEAKGVCWGYCPVRSECLSWALQTRQREGVWGGKTAEERRAMQRRDRGRAA